MMHGQKNIKLRGAEQAKLLQDFNVYAYLLLPIFRFL